MFDWHHSDISNSSDRCWQKVESAVLWNAVHWTRSDCDSLSQAPKILSQQNSVFAPKTSHQLFSPKMHGWSALPQATTPWPSSVKLWSICFLQLCTVLITCSPILGMHLFLTWLSYILNAGVYSLSVWCFVLSLHCSWLSCTRRMNRLGFLAKQNRQTRLAEHTSFSVRSLIRRSWQGLYMTEPKLGKSTIHRPRLAKNVHVLRTSSPLFITTLNRIFCATKWSPGMWNSGIWMGRVKRTSI